MCCSLVVNLKIHLTSLIDQSVTTPLCTQDKCMFVLVAGRKMALVQVAEGQDYYNYAGTLGLPNAATTCNLCRAHRVTKLCMMPLHELQIVNCCIPHFISASATWVGRPSRSATHAACIFLQSTSYSICVSGLIITQL